MSIVEQLKDTSHLPTELKALLVELQVPTNDPVIPLLVWIWKQMIDTKAVLDSARASTAAIFDTRLEKMNQMAQLMRSVDITLNAVQKQLEAKPLRVKEQVEQELTVPIKAAVASCQTLDKQVKSLLGRIDNKVAGTKWALYLALVTAGFMGGGFTVLCLGRFLF